MIPSSEVILFNILPSGDTKIDAPYNASIYVIPL